MTNKNLIDLTNEDIISSLKVIATTRNCNECKIRNCKWGTCNCEQTTANAALDLINRQKEEIERLKTELDFAKAFRKETSAEFSLMHRKYDNMLKAAKAEARKEFAEELKEGALFPHEINDDYAIGLETIDNLLKEMGSNSKDL